MEALAPRQNSAFSGYEWLKQDIIRGVFKPGEKLLMSALKERYDLGVGPLREALSQLVAEKLVVAISQKGYRVAPMSLEEMRDIYDARANLEAMIVGLAGLVFNVTADNVIRLLPALIISEAEGREVVERLVPLVKEFLGRSAAQPTKAALGTPHPVTAAAR